MSIEKTLTKLSRANQELANRLVTAANNKKPLPKTAQQYLDIVKANKVKVLSVRCSLETSAPLENKDYLVWNLKVEFDISCSVKTFINMKKELEKFASKFSKIGSACADVFFNLPYLDDMDDSRKYYFTTVIAEKNPNYTGKKGKK